MKLKQDVTMNGIKPELVLGLMVADSIWKKYGEELVITSITDSRHSKNSRHYIGLAADLRTRYFDKPTALRVANELKTELGDEFFVLLESTHVHIQFNGSVG